MEKAVFIDKDNTIIHDVPYNVNPEKIKMFKEAGQALKTIKDLGFKIIVASNQSGVARGMFEEKDLKPVTEKIQNLLEPHGVKIDRFCFCPHHPKGNVEEYAISCKCRKPSPGLILRVAEDMDIDLEKSWMVGDILNDIEAGNKTGCKTILVDKEGETEWRLSLSRLPNFIVNNLSQAAEIIKLSQ